MAFAKQMREKYCMCMKEICQMVYLEAYVFCNEVICKNTNRCTILCSLCR
jgi:hypothetical protein